VFYPIDYEEFEEKYCEEKDIHWLRHGLKSLQAMHNRAAAFLKSKPAPLFLDTDLLQKKIHVAKGAQLSKDFKEKPRSLTPIVFSHGNGTSGLLYTGFSKELASLGYIVFAVDHSDGSCLYTPPMNDGIDMTFPANDNLFDLELK